MNEDPFFAKSENTWKMYCDGNRIGILHVVLDGSHISIPVKLNFDVINNVANYEAGIARLRFIGIFLQSSCNCTSCGKLRRRI